MQWTGCTRQTVAKNVVVNLSDYEPFESSSYAFCSWRCEKCQIFTNKNTT